MQSAAVLPNSVIIYLYSSVSLWSTDSPNSLILSSSSSSLISLTDFTILIYHDVTHQPHRPCTSFIIFIINLTHLIQLIVNLSHKSVLSNLISLLHLTVTKNSLVHLTITNNSLVTLTVTLTAIFTLSAIATNRYWRNTL